MSESAQMSGGVSLNAHEAPLATPPEALEAGST